MKMPDIYFEEFWGKLHSHLEQLIYGQFEFKCGEGEGYYHFLKRKAPYLVDGKEYFDTITPYGFNGPVILDCDESGRKLFVRKFNEEFQKYCGDTGIIAEYVRFSPWLKNHLDFKEVYNTRYNNYTLGIDLTKDFFMEEFSSKCRNMVRKSQKSGVVLQYDTTGETIDQFHHLYQMMARKNNIDSAYMFSEDYFREIADKCGGRVFLLNAVYNGTIVSSAMFLISGSYLHYHFSANHDDYMNLAANNYILYEACRWGKAHGKKNLHLGGAFSESLFRFKKSFTKNGIYDFYVGTRIRNEEIYNQQIRMSGKEKNSYFPAYRGV